MTAAEPLDRATARRAALGLLANAARQGREVTVRAQGESMAPAFPSGTKIEFSAIDPATLLPGTCVVVEGPGGLVVHRLVAHANGAWTTKGDHSIFADPPVEPGALLGQVTRVGGWPFRAGRADRWIAALSHRQARLAERMQGGAGPRVQALLARGMPMLEALHIAKAEPAWSGDPRPISWPVRAAFWPYLAAVRLLLVLRPLLGGFGDRRNGETLPR